MESSSESSNYQEQYEHNLQTMKNKLIIFVRSMSHLETYQFISLFTFLIDSDDLYQLTVEDRHTVGHEGDFDHSCLEYEESSFGEDSSLVTDSGLSPTEAGERK